MAKHLQEYRFQKCSDIDKELPIFEVVTKNGTIIIDISMNDENGDIEVFFHDGIAKTIVTIGAIRQIIDEGEALLRSEMSSA